MLLDGFLGVNKPSQCTSHDVVAQIRRLYHIKKVGHTGTLDPMATGVLILCLGKFTRLSQFVSAADKKYRAEFTLGIETDTQDSEGQVVREDTQIPQTLVEFEQTLKVFLGKGEQIPPMYSAVRVGGKRLYDLARQGQEVVRDPRPIEIFALDVVEYDAPHLTLDVWCSKGTYIRTLASDFGTEVGCGAHLSKLERTAVGGISLSDCHSLDALGKSDVGSLPFLDPKSVLALPSVCLTQNELRAFVNGNSVPLDDGGLDFEQSHCVFDGDDQLIGIGRSHPEGLRPMRVIAQRES